MALFNQLNASLNIINGLIVICFGLLQHLVHGHNLTDKGLVPFSRN